MGLFPSSHNYKYIVVMVNYVSKWVKTIATRTNNTKVVLKFVKWNIFSRFGVPNAIVSDERKYFCNKQLKSLLLKYGCGHKMSLPCHL